MLNNNKFEFVWFWLAMIGLVVFLGVIVGIKMQYFEGEDKNKETSDNLVTKDSLLNQRMGENSNKNLIDEKQGEQLTMFRDEFSTPRVIEEIGQMEASGDKDWWLNSGAFLYIKNGTARTIFGKLRKENKWQKKYQDYNPLETDGGYRPQNIFRLVTRSKWQNFQQECYFKIHHYELSSDEHRSASNGLFLFNRYEDGDNLYYTGLRVDGTVVVKKKYKGKYYLMAQKKILPGKYNRQEMPNLLPENKWLGLRSEVQTIADDQVEIKVFVKLSPKKDWRKVITIKDDGNKYGGRAILAKAFAGVRTDFMDVELDNYEIK